MRRRKRIREEAGNPFRFALGILFLVSGIFVSQTAAAQGAPESDEPAPEYAPGPDAPPYAPEPLPRTLTLAAGTVISVRTTQFLSSDQNRAGDGFGAELEQPLVVDGWVVARRGQTVLGRVVMAQKAGRVKGVSQLAVEVTHLVMVARQSDSRSNRVHADFWWDLARARCPGSRNCRGHGSHRRRHRERRQRRWNRCRGGRGCGPGRCAPHARSRHGDPA